MLRHPLFYVGKMLNVRELAKVDRVTVLPSLKVGNLVGRIGIAPNDKAVRSVTTSERVVAATPYKGIVAVVCRNHIRILAAN